MASKTQSDTELTDTKVNNTEESNEEVEKPIAPTSFLRKIKNFFIFFTVEPFLLCYVFPTAILYVPIQSFNFEKACRADLNYSEIICNGDSNDTVITLAASNATQTLLTAMATWKEPLQSGIPAIVILFVGAWSDKTGNRKSLMLIPILGDLISCIGLILTTYFFLEWPLWVTGLIQALPLAFSGGFSIALMGSYSYLSDVTTVETRTFRMGCVAVIVTLALPIGTSFSGALLELVGFYGIFGIGAILYTLGFIYTCFKIHDVKVVKMEGTFMQKVIEFFHPKNAWDTLSLLFLSPKRELILIWIVVCAHILVIGPVLGEGSLVYLYTRTAFGMSDVDFSLFSSYSILMGIAGMSVVVSVFIKYFKIHDSLIGVIATSSKVIGTFVYGFAPTRAWFFAGPIFDFFGNSGSVVVRSLGTKIVPVDKVAKMCSIIGFVEAILPVIYVPIFNRMYSATLTTLPGAFYLMGGFFTMPAILIFIYLYYLHRKQDRDVVKNPESKEMYAQDNVLTVL